MADDRQAVQVRLGEEDPIKRTFEDDDDITDTVLHTSLNVCIEYRHRAQDALQEMEVKISNT